ncbi:twin-arginine translocase TatA/TatE family subunit [Deinococcus sp. UR1]|uniref:twin-arginine translocase TatA/TatE family subunit n=1 Tax=Deinococcus sp. UR1 TaxID=1704277 RepID=UPI000C1A0F50|nr:twin-arginine translocase TatA/TatE family subunit [Deinococcus sp. UR1]PIG98950.1 twin-arginine translocase TatA/TatE family subunit [Deinococcus sp. UR1]
MPNIGPAELLVILLVALVVFGPRKLPELGKSLGAGLREFRKSTQSLKDGLDGTLNDPPPAAPAQTIHAQAAVPVAAAGVTPGAQPMAAQPVAAQTVAAQPVTVQPLTVQPVEVPQPAAPDSTPAVTVAKEPTHS